MKNCLAAADLMPLSFACSKETLLRNSEVHWDSTSDAWQKSQGEYESPWSPTVAWAIRAYTFAAFSGSGVIFPSCKSFFKCKKNWCLHERETATIEEDSWHKQHNMTSMKFSSVPVALQSHRTLQESLLHSDNISFILPCRILKQILRLDKKFYAKLQSVRWSTGNLSSNPVSRI